MSTVFPEYNFSQGVSLKFNLTALMLIPMPPICSCFHRLIMLSAAQEVAARIKKPAMAKSVALPPAACFFDFYSTFDKSVLEQSAYFWKGKIDRIRRSDARNKAGASEDTAQNSENAKSDNSVLSELGNSELTQGLALVLNSTILDLGEFMEKSAKREFASKSQLMFFDAKLRFVL